METVRREGLTVLHNPQDAKLDLVIIHGLNGTPYRTFCHERTGFFWPTELAKTLPTARIMVFGYVADISSGATNALGVYQHAESLLLHLKNNRFGTSQEKRPIVFIGHSLGGVVIKQAMIISSHRPLDASILQSTKLIVFLGTPHRGSHVLDSSIAKAGLSFMKLANREIPKNVKSMLQPRGDESFMINTDFIRVKGQIEIVNFYEQVARAHLQDLVVDKDSAVFDSERSENIPVARDHEHLVRFESPEDDAYHTLRQTLQRKVTKAIEILDEMEKEGYSDRLMRACLSSLGELALSTNFGQPKEAHQKTLNWLWDIDSELFAWIKTGSGIFAVTGKPGSGKSVLMNEVATRVRKRHRHQFGVIVQYAFNARGAPREHSFDGFLRFAISQVLRQRPSSFEAVVDEWVHLAHDSGLYGVGNGLRDLDEVGSILWPIPSLKTALVSATAHAARESPVCFIIDALDECDGGAESIHDLVTFISDMVSALPPNSEDSIKICFSCRDLPSNFGGAIAGGFRMEHRNEPDIAAYVNDRWSTLESIVEPGNNLKQIKTDLVKKADGIFLWAYLALERIQTALRDGATVAELQETVNDIPEELGGLFALLLGNINPKYTAETNTMLAVALSAGRPLSLTEFRYATALSTSLGTMSHSGLEKSPTFVPDDGTMRKRIRSRCGGLLEVKAWNETTGDEDGLGPHYTEVVQFIHQSVKDSLLANLSKQPSGTQQSHSLISEGHDKLARCCLQYLSTKEVQELASHIRADSRVDKRWLQRRKKELPFLNYAVESCFHHCQQAEKSGISHAELIDQLFAPEDERFSDYVALRNAVHKGEKYSPGLSVLQLAVEHDLANYVELRLILDPADVNAVLDCGDNYVQIAVRKEHVKTLKVLVAHGADVNSSHSSYSPSEVELYKSLYNQVRPLVVACQKGNIEMVQLLLEHGADVSACDSYRGHTHINQALVSAAYSGSIEVVRRLLDSDHSSLSHPDIRVSAIAGLSYALHKRLYNETKSDARSYRKQEHEAELEKMRQISDLILSDIDVHQIGFEMGSAALFWYHTGCQKEVLQRLIDIGTDFVGIDMNSMPFLYAACLRGTASSVQMLLQNNVDPHITLGPSDSSYLHAALLGKTPAVLSYLLQHGLEVDLQDKNGETPLHAAAAYGTDDFIDVLLYHNADIGMRDLSGRRPFWHAVGNRGLKHTVNILERLLYQDSDIQLVDRDGITPLHNAAECGSLAAVEWLLSRGADPTALDDWGLTALHWAAASASVDSTDCLALLLNHKPPTSTKPRLDINARDSSDLTSLHYVLRFWTFHRSDPISNSDPSVAIANAKLLLQRGADLDAIDNAGNTPLHLAALRGIKELVRLFLREGADPNACDVNGLRPLDLAHLEDVRELLEDAMAANDAAYGAA